AIPPPPPQTRRPLRVGDAVRVRTLNANGVIGAIYADDLEVQIGALRTRVKLSEIERLRSAEKAPEPASAPEPAQRAVVGVSMELDLRGLNGEEAMPLVEDYLDKASRAGLPFVRLIHGKGTGALRKAVRTGLRGNPLIKSLENGLDGEGGDGVTVVKLRGE
ncbi:MAG: Smr/MutS family protein, partial [Thermoflexales bacterium]|nr:Smr/MutS family protein [Thermoflexales bacterium]